MRLDKKKVASLVRSDFGQQMLHEGDRAQAGNPEKEQVWLLLIDEIDPDPAQPRRHFDEAALSELAADITRRGVLQPILVRPTGDRYQIIVGERRWRASRQAGKPRIPCLIRDLDATAARQAQLVENVIREGISDIERGLALRQLYEDMKAADRRATWEHIAQMVGLTRMRINHLYNLSNLPRQVVDMIQTRRLSGSHGVELARLHGRPEALLRLAEGACRPQSASGPHGLSVAQLRDRVSAELGAQRARRRPPASLARIRQNAVDLVSSLRPDLPAEVRTELGDAARQILRWLEQPINEPSVKSTLHNGPPPEPPGPDRPNVKSTLQSRGGRAER